MVNQISTRERWRKIVEAYEVSGQSQRAFALQNGLSPSSLCSWRRKLQAKRPVYPSEMSFTTINVTEDEGVDERVVRLSLRDYRADLIIDKGSDLSFVRDVLAALC